MIVTLDTAVSVSESSVALAQPVTSESGAMVTVNVSSSSSRRSVAVVMSNVAVVALAETVTVVGGLDDRSADVAVFGLLYP